MLAKVPKKRIDGKTSFSVVIDYVSRPASSLVLSDSLWSAVTAAGEMGQVSLMNERIKDPVYHYVLSWPAGEKPSDDQAFDAIRCSVAELGMAEHQWIGAVHRNTSNVHVHVVVNRIHPIRLTSVYPLQDWIILDRTCRQLELKHGWSHDRGPNEVNLVDRLHPRVTRSRHHSTTEAQPSTKARDFSAWTGLDSFQGWVSGGPARELQRVLASDSPCWGDVHATLYAFNLEYKIKGSGAIIVDMGEPDRLHAKASHLGRFASKARLEAVLGAFQEPKRSRSVWLDADAPLGTARNRYSYTQAIDGRSLEVAVRRRNDDGLYERYLKRRNEWLTVGRPRYRLAWERQRKTERLRVRTVQEMNRSARQHIRRTYPAQIRRALYSYQAWLCAASRQQVRDQSTVERARLRASWWRDLPQKWRDWLNQEAAAGDEAAKKRLRAIHLRERRQVNPPSMAAEIGTVTSSSIPKSVLFGSYRVVAGRDCLNYCSGTSLAFSDKGRRVAFYGGSDEYVRAGLLLCREKWGPNLTITGSGSFQRTVASLTRELGIHLSSAVDSHQEVHREPRRPIENGCTTKHPWSVGTQEEIHRLCTSLGAELLVCEPRVCNRHTGKVVAVVVDKSARDYVILLDLGHRLGAFNTELSVAREVQRRIGQRIVFRSPEFPGSANTRGWHSWDIDKARSRRSRER